MKNFELKTFANDLELAQAAAREWLALLEEDRLSNLDHLVALSGGRITKTFFSQIVAQGKSRPELFSKVHFFWTDERCVPPNDPESNFLMADQLLFQPLKIAPEKIHRLRGEIDPVAAVAEANAKISRLAPKNSAGLPVLDSILLGMGPDGHIASLFPNASEEIIQSQSAYLAIDNSPKPPPRRITLTFAAIAAAKQVWLLASGEGKEKAFAESLAPDGQTPVARVLHARAHTKIFSDVHV